MPTLDRSRYAAASGLKRGGYVLADMGGEPEVILISTGSEVSLCVEVYEKLASEGVKARVVSMPSWELFEQQDAAYRAAVLPPAVTRRVAVEQASTLGWERIRWIARHDHRHEDLRGLGAVEGASRQIWVYPRTRLCGCQGAARPQGVMTMPNPLRTLNEFGQSVWLDFVSRELLRTGALTKLIADDGLRGVTSNPSIFEKAIGHGDDYDELIAAAQATGDLDPGALFEELAVRDIQEGADALRPVYHQTQGRDGFISLEVSPYLAMKTHETIEEARRLWREVGRENLMVKVPGTKAGLPAIRTLIGEGININVTLLFSQEVYAEVADAYVSGLEAFARKGGDPHKVASVASFFVSRIDTLVDEALDKRIAAAADPAEKTRLERLKGKIAIANAKLAYQLYKKIYGDERWQRLAQQGAQTQRLLWASTGTKNKAYSDVLYVDELIGADTVNTIPPATMDAYRDHGRPRPSLEEDVESAKAVMAALPGAGISIEAVTAKLVEDGVRQFADAADQLYAAVQKKRRAVLGPKLDQMSCKLPAALDKEVQDTLEEWRREGKVRRLWAGDASLWTETDEAKWVGWLTVVDQQLNAVADLQDFAADVRRSRVPRCAAARDGRFEPRPRGVRRDLRGKARFPGVARARTRPTRRRSAISRA